MKQSKSQIQEPKVEKPSIKNYPVQNPTAPKKDDKPSWAVYYLLGMMVLGILLLILKVIGVF